MKKKNESSYIWPHARNENKATSQSKLKAVIRNWCQARENMEPKVSAGKYGTRGKRTTTLQTENLLYHQSFGHFSVDNTRKLLKNYAISYENALLWLGP